MFNKYDSVNISSSSVHIRCAVELPSSKQMHAMTFKLCQLQAVGRSVRRIAKAQRDFDRKEGADIYHQLVVVKGRQIRYCRNSPGRTETSYEYILECAVRKSTTFHQKKKRKRNPLKHLLSKSFRYLWVNCGR